MARKDKRHAKQKDNDENNDEQRKQKEEKKKEDEKKRTQRRKKANRPALADTPANLGLSNLYGEEEERDDEAGPSTADVTPSIGGLFDSRPSAEDDALLESSEKDDDDDEDDDDEEESGAIEGNSIAQAAADVDDDAEVEGMEVDPSVDSIQEPSPPTDAQAAPPSPARRRAVRCTGQLRQGEVTVEPASMQLTTTQSDGPKPVVMRSVGIQAEYGRETLQKRWKRVLVTRERLAEKKRKRKAPASPTREGQAATSPSAAQNVPPPPSEVQRPAFMQAKRPKPTTVDKPQLSSTVVVPEGRNGSRQSKTGTADTSRKGKSRGPGGEAKKDQRVVVVLPSKAPAANPPPPPREPRQRSRSPRDHSSRGHHSSYSSRSASRSAQARKKEEEKKEEDRRHRPYSQRRRSPSPRPSTSRHASLPSLPSHVPNFPNMASGGSFDQIQWMAAALSTAFLASQQFGNQQRPRADSPPPSSHRSRSFSRKGKGPGRGKGGGRGR